MPEFSLVYIVPGFLISLMQSTFEHLGARTNPEDLVASKVTPTENASVLRDEESVQDEATQISTNCVTPAPTQSQNEVEAHQSQLTSKMSSSPANESTNPSQICTEPTESTATTKSKRAPSVERLEKLAQPKVAVEAPETAPQMPELKPEKKKRDMRPSLLLRVRPMNLDEAMEEFFASGCTKAPRFEYTHPEEYVQKHFEANSQIDFELLPEAKRILQKVQDEYGGVAAFNKCLYGDEKVSPEELKGTVEQYLQELGLQDKAEVRVNDKMLSAANVVQNDDRYVVNITAQQVSKNMVQGICDHEVGTHLLRMANDEHQVWHGCRDRYKLSNPWTTEEGFATLNTYLSMTCKLMYPQALGYWAVCRGAQLGFVELFHELESHVQDQVKRFRMCCRIKRGMIDTSLPGAFYIQQTYFKGAVELLRHLDEIDFGRLYCGQVALQDLDKVHFLLRKDIVRFPKFLKCHETLKAYKAHCRVLIKQNEISVAVERVCKQMFIRTAKEFFKKPKQQLKLASGSINTWQAASIGPVAEEAPRTVDLSRLLEMAKPRDPPGKVDQGVRDQPINDATTGELDRDRLVKLSQPKQYDDWATVPVLKAAQALLGTNKKQGSKGRGSSEPAPGSRGDVLEAERSINIQRLSELSRPRPPVSSSDADSLENTCVSMPKVSRALNVARLLKLASPRQKSSKEAVPEVQKPKKKKKKKRRSKCRLVAIVQDQIAIMNGEVDPRSRDQRPQEVIQSEEDESDEETQNDPSIIHDNNATDLVESSTVAPLAALDPPLATRSSPSHFPPVQEPEIILPVRCQGGEAERDINSVTNSTLLQCQKLSKNGAADLLNAQTLISEVGSSTSSEAMRCHDRSHSPTPDFESFEQQWLRRPRTNSLPLAEALETKSRPVGAGQRHEISNCDDCDRRSRQETRDGDLQASAIDLGDSTAAGTGARAVVRLRRATSVGASCRRSDTEGSISASRRLSSKEPGGVEDNFYPLAARRRCAPAMRAGDSEWRPVPIKTLQLGI